MPANPLANGALVLFSNTPAPAQPVLIDRILANRPRPAGEPVRLVVLQTPMAEPQHEQVEGFDRHFSGHGVAIDAIDGGLQTRADAHDPAVIARIDTADIVLVTGGNPERMADAMLDTPAEDALRRVLKRGGIVGGGSAGAMVWGRAVPLGAASHPTGSQPLLGWLPNLVVAPHFGNYPIDGWRTLFPDATILGLPDGAVVVVEANATGAVTFTNMSAIAAHLISPGEPTRDLTHGVTIAIDAP